MGLKEKIRRYRPARPERVPDSPEVKARLQMKIQIWDEWKASGKYTAKNPDGSWRHTITDLNREAKNRMEVDQ